MMRSPRRVLGALACAGLILSGVGCGGGGAGDEVAVVDRLDLLSAVEEAGSARVSFRFDDDGSGAGLSPEQGGWRMEGVLEGVVSFGETRSEMSGTMDMAVLLPPGAVDEPPPALSWGIELRAVGEESWYRETMGGESGPWVREPGLDELGGTEGDEVDGGLVGGEPDGEGPDGALAGVPPEDRAGDDPFSLLDPTSFDPVGFITALRDGAEGFTEEGGEEVRGEDTTRYRAEVDPSMDGSGDWYGIDGVVEVWLDGQERLRRVRGGSLEMELWDFGVPVEVEPPDEVVDIDEWSGTSGLVSPTEVTGEWSVQAEGTTGGQAWQVFVVQARQGEDTLSCRTLELVGGASDEDMGGFEPPWLDEEGGAGLPFVHHDGTMATCGSGGFFALGGHVVDPALQLLSPELGMSPASADLVGFVVSERFRDAPVRVVLEGEGTVELPLDDTGLAVWSGSTTAPVVAVELDGGSVRCPVVSYWDDVDPEYSTTAAQALAVGTAPCVRT